jgi:hypothetical protein
MMMVSKLPFQFEYPMNTFLRLYYTLCVLTLSLLLEDDDDDGGGSPFDDENDLQDLVEDAIYRFPLGDHDTGNIYCSFVSKIDRTSNIKR